MGRARGQRNAAREKAWPGERADQLREAKRDWETYSCDGIMNWEALQEEADRLMPEIPTIERGTMLRSQSINVCARTKLAEPDFINGAFNREFWRLEKIEKRLSTLSLAIPSSKISFAIPAPLASTPLNYAPIKHPESICDRCGGPRGGPKGGYLPNPYTASKKLYCRVCFRLNARERREKLIAEIKAKPLLDLQKKQELFLKKKEEIEHKKAVLLQDKEKIIDKHYSTPEQREAALQEINEAISSYSFWLDEFLMCGPKEMPAFNGMAWDSAVAGQKMMDGTSHVWTRFCPDFSDEVLDAIEEAEEAIGIPVAKWPSWKTYTDLFATEENKKRLHSAHDSYERMTPKTTREFVRRQRPKWKSLRGQWA